MFRRKKKFKESPVTDKVAGKIAGGIVSVQTSFSRRMNKVVGNMTIQKLKLFLVVFCLTSGGLSIYFIISSLTSTTATPMKIERVRMPANLNKAGDEIMEHSISPEMYQDIQSYKNYMDSIGEPIRPTLLDSIKMLEQIYLQQQK